MANRCKHSAVRIQATEVWREDGKGVGIYVAAASIVVFAGRKNKSPGPLWRDRGGFKPSLRGEVLVKTQVHYILEHGSTRRQVGGIQK
jgi:hypothetical protein